MVGGDLGGDDSGDGGAASELGVPGFQGGGTRLAGRAAALFARWQISLQSASRGIVCAIRVDARRGSIGSLASDYRSGVSLRRSLLVPPIQIVLVLVLERPYRRGAWASFAVVDWQPEQWTSQSVDYRAAALWMSGCARLTLDLGSRVHRDCDLLQDLSVSDRAFTGSD